MSTVNRTVETDDDKKMALRLIEGRSVPFTLSLTDGKQRSTAQNKLQRMWMNEIAEQRGDMTAEEARGYCKLTIGVPLLRAENDAFREGYDKVVKPLPYEQKLAIMMEPLDLPVTRLMTTKQKSEYLDGIIRHFGEQGIVLTMPDDMRSPNNEASPASPTQAAEDVDGTPHSAPSQAEVPSDEPAGDISAPVGSLFGKFNYEGDDIKNLREFAEKAIREFRRSGEIPCSNLIEAMHPRYASELVSADAVTALESIKREIELVLKGDRNVDRIEQWFETEFFQEA